MSSDEAAKPSTTSTNPGFIAKGVVPHYLKDKVGSLTDTGLKRCKAVKLLPPSFLEHIKPTLDVSTLSQLTAQSQEFSGKMLPSSSSTADYEMKPLKKKDTKVRVQKPVKEEEPQDRTRNYNPPKLRMTEELQDDVEEDEDLEEEDKDILKGYVDGQKENIRKNLYMTSTNLYTTQTRKNFYNFVENNYYKFRIASKPIYTTAAEKDAEQKYKEEACTLMDNTTDTAVQAFIYQKFIREYIRNASPYRGILVYHGLGSGKTCSAIAAAEAIYGSTGKKIIIMTPFSLRGNFIGEISFCGFKHFSVNNYWSPVPMNDTVRLYAESVLSISPAYMNEIQKIADKAGDDPVIWVPNFEETTSNYKELDPTAQEQIRKQIINSIETRITFINYNGITESRLREMACETDDNGNRIFDNAVIVIDEIHNLTRLMSGNIIQYLTSRPGQKRTIPAEPVKPGRWEPLLCSSSDKKYSRAILFYRMLSDARNSKIIGLSGTPLINFPEELGIMANILAGYTECIEIECMSTEKSVLANFAAICKRHPRVDTVRQTTGRQQVIFVISILNEGYRKAKSKEIEKYENNMDMEGMAIIYDKSQQQTIQEISKEIYADLAEESIPLAPEKSIKYVSYPRLPVDSEDFRDNFIDIRGNDIKIKNEIVLGKRLTGLISYYKGSKEEYMPRTIDHVVKCEMSDYTLSLYSKARTEEINQEAEKESDGGNLFAAVEMYSKLKNPSSYRFRSRAICNFSFPAGIQRPFPNMLVSSKKGAKESVSDAAVKEPIDDKTKKEIEQLENDEIAPIEEMVDEDTVIAKDGEIALEEEASMPEVSIIEAVEAPPSEQSGGMMPSKPASKLDALKAKIAAEKKGLSPAAKPAAKLVPSFAPPARKTLKPLAPLPESSVDTSILPPVEISQQPFPSISSLPPASLPAASLPASLPSTSLPSASLPPASLPASLPTASLPTASLPPASLPTASLPAASLPPASLPASLPASTSIFDTNPSISVLTAAESKSDEPPSKSKFIPQKRTLKSSTNSLSTIAATAASSGLPSVSTITSTAASKEPIISEPVESTEAAPKKLLKDLKESIASFKIPSASKSVSKAASKDASKSVSKAASKKDSRQDSKIEVLEEEKEEKKDNVEITQYMLSYKEQIKQAMDTLDERRGDFLTLDTTVPERCIKNYSAKLYEMILNINKSKGSNLVYSQFKTVEGLGVLGVALKANGFSEIIIEGNDDNLHFSSETITSLMKGPTAREKRYILFTGEGSRARRAIVLAVFNGQFNKLPPAMSNVLSKAGYSKHLNKYGDICWVIGITGAGAEGISLKCCRSVHIMEPYWNNVRLEQVKGRAVRICSHKDLPYDQRTVDVYMYYTVFTRKQMSEITTTIQFADKNKDGLLINGQAGKEYILTSDEKVFEVSSKKDKVNGLLLDLMKRFAVDCVINNADNSDVEKCTVVSGHAYEYMFNPNLEQDIIESTSVKESNTKDVSRGDLLDSSTSSNKIRINLLKYKGEQYVIYPKADSGGRVFHLFLQETFREDKPDSTAPNGEISVNPITQKIDSGSTISMY